MTTVPLQHQRYLSPPCTNSLPLENINIKDKDVLSKMPMFMSFFATRYDLIKSNIEVELSILSQFLYKNHNRFRNDKCHRYLKLIQKTTHRFLKDLTLDKEVLNFSGVFPIPMDIKNKNKIYLPTKQMLQFILMRLYGGANLLWKLIIYCQNAGELCVQRLKLGHFWNIGLNNLSCVSRLWALSTSMLILVEKAYQCFLLLLPMLPVSNVKWLGTECNNDFPSNIAQVILGEDCENFDAKFKNVSDNLPEFVKSLAATSKDNDLFDLRLSADVGEIILRDGLDENEIPGSTLLLATNSKMPIGESKIEVPECNPEILQLDMPCSHSKWKKLNARISNHTKHPKHLKCFVQEENQIRKTSRNTALTKLLGQDQWKALRNDLNACIDKLKYTKEDKEQNSKILRKSRNLLICWILYPQLKGMKPVNWDQICDKFSKNDVT